MDASKPPPKRLVIGGAAVALGAGLLIAWIVATRHGAEPAGPPPASRAGLVIDSAEAEAPADQARPLRCFVQGQMVGELPLAECAKRNGVATDALDVGLDQTGALAAAGHSGAMITPLPPAAAQDAPAVEAQAEDACWRYAEGQWTRLSTPLPLKACVQTIFPDPCVRTPGAAYGRWGQQTVRLYMGRVETSPDNHTFAPATDPELGCAASR